jgi:hypothetical protein
MKKFSEAKFTAVGAFIFLRFFCPAIVAPDVEGLISSAPSKEMRRGLLLIAKVVQNLANNVLFGAKEPYMFPLNDFLTQNIYRVTTFLREISVCLHPIVSWIPISNSVRSRRMLLIPPLNRRLSISALVSPFIDSCTITGIMCGRRLSLVKEKEHSYRLWTSARVKFPCWSLSGNSSQTLVLLLWMSPGIGPQSPRTVRRHTLASNTSCSEMLGGILSP